MKRLLLFLSVACALTLAVASGAWGQSPVGAQLQIKKDALVSRLRAAKQKKIAVTAADLNPGSEPELYMLALAFSQPRGVAVRRELAKVVEAARVDKQLGSGSSASGSTSVTEKGAVPKILAFAVENGALTRTQSGTTISFKANPAGIANSLIAGSAPPTGALARLAVGLEFDASRGAGAGQPAVFVGDQQQLSAFNVKYEILNHRDPDSPEFQNRAQTLYNQSRSDATPSTQTLNKTLLGFETGLVASLTTAHRAEFSSWSNMAMKALNSAPEEALMDVLNEQLAMLPMQVPFTSAELADFDQYVEIYGHLLDSRDALLALAGKGAVMSVEYVNSRPVDQPTESTIKWLFEWSALSGKLDLSANASTTLLNGSLEDGIERWQAWAVSGQMDMPLGSIVQGRSLVFTVSGRAEAKIVPLTNDRDTIWLGQAKVTFPVKDAGVKIPLSVTVASRTDLIDERVVRANIGFTFNVDSFFGQ